MFILLFFVFAFNQTNQFYTVFFYVIMIFGLFIELKRTVFSVEIYLQNYSDFSGNISRVFS